MIINYHELLHKIKKTLQKYVMSFLFYYLSFTIASITSMYFCGKLNSL